MKEGKQGTDLSDRRGKNTKLSDETYGNNLIRPQPEVRPPSYCRASPAGHRNQAPADAG